MNIYKLYKKETKTNIPTLVGNFEDLLTAVLVAKSYEKSTFITEPYIDNVGELVIYESNK